MKAKTLMGMIACASACASISAFGNTTNNWFSVGVSNDAIAPVNCLTNGVAVSIDNSKIVLDNDYETKLAITPAVALSNTNSTDVAKIDVTALLTPSSTNDLAVIQDAKAGFAVGIDDQNRTNFYGFANGEWIKLTGDASNADTQDTTFSIVLDYRVPNVRFYLGDTLLASATNQSATAFTIEGNTFGGIDAFGSGSIASIAGGYEVAVAAATVDGVDKKFGSAVEALAAADANTTLKDVAPNGAPTTTHQASNGLFAWECDVLNVAEDAQVALQPSGVDGNNIKLSLAVEPDTGANVTFNVVPAAGGEAVETGCLPTAIKIPATASGKYKIVPVITKASN